MEFLLSSSVNYMAVLFDNSIICTDNCWKDEHKEKEAENGPLEKIEQNKTSETSFVLKLSPDLFKCLKA